MSVMQNSGTILEIISEVDKTQVMYPVVRETSYVDGKVATTISPDMDESTTKRINITIGEDDDPNQFVLKCSLRTLSKLNSLTKKKDKCVLLELPSQDWENILEAMASIVDAADAAMNATIVASMVRPEFANSEVTFTGDVASAIFCNTLDIDTYNQITESIKNSTTRVLANSYLANFNKIKLDVELRDKYRVSTHRKFSETSRALAKEISTKPSHTAVAPNLQATDGKPIVTNVADVKAKAIVETTKVVDGSFKSLI